MESNELFLSYLNRSSVRGVNLLNIVAKQYEFIEALNSPVGQQLSHDLFILHDNLLEKIYNESANEQDKAEFRVVKKLIRIYADKIQKYLQASEKIEKVVEAKGG